MGIVSVSFAECLMRVAKLEKLVNPDHHIIFL